MAHNLTQEEWECEMAEKVISLVRDELYMDLRYIDAALSALVPKSCDSLNALATDGTYLYFRAGQVIDVFEKNPAFLDRAYLHAVLHCLFGHMWVGGERDRRLWNLSCDIAVEYTIDKIDKPCTRRILSYIRKQLYERFAREKSGISAAVIYRMIADESEEELRRLAAEFFTDDHCFWPKETDDNAKNQSEINEAKKRWDKIAHQTSLNQTRRGDDTEEGEQMLAAQMTAEKSKRSYKDFLEQFSVLREEIGIDPDEFDLGYYTFGLGLYGNMPLIEPLESREIKKIQEFVIAIDTSYSTSSGLVEDFLKETFGILTQRNSFFRESRVRIIQCDDKVRMDREITNEVQIEALMHDFTLTGGGGTDFTPVFAYVNDLIDAGEIGNLGGLLYFTDGKGTYPAKCPPYKTAFIYMEPLSEEDAAAVPPWAIRFEV
jgi:predicted metal-dependent peptidase